MRKFKKEREKVLRANDDDPTKLLSLNQDDRRGMSNETRRQWEESSRIACKFLLYRERKRHGCRALRRRTLERQPLSRNVSPNSRYRSNSWDVCLPSISCIGYITRRISGKVCRRCDFDATFVSLSALWRSKDGWGMTVRVIVALLSAPSPLTPSATSRYYVGLAETDTLGPINSTSKLPL